MTAPKKPSPMTAPKKPRKKAASRSDMALMLLTLQAQNARIEALERQMTDMQRSILATQQKSPYLSVNEVADFSRYSAAAIRLWCKKYNFADREGRRPWKIRRADFAAWWRARFNNVPRWLAD